jgi:hypothetical protein
VKGATLAQFGYPASLIVISAVKLRKAAKPKESSMDVLKVKRETRKFIIKFLENEKLVRDPKAVATFLGAIELHRSDLLEAITKGDE